jgi:class 3 adenylate cyclase
MAPILRPQAERPSHKELSIVVTPLELALAIAAVVVLVVAAAGAGYAVGARGTVVTPEEPETTQGASRTSIGALVSSTGAELAHIAVRTGVEIGSRALRDSLGSLSAWAQQERPDLRNVTGEDGTVTLMFTDIEGSTAANQRLGDDRWLAILAVHDRLLRRCVRSNRGHVIKTQGDSFMVAFAVPDNALACAVTIQQQLVTLDVGERVALRVRIGLHTGPAIARGRDLFGINVATAARVAGEARGGEILVTDQFAERLTGEHDVGQSRKVSLKGITGTHRVRSVQWDAAAAQVAPTATAGSVRPAGAGRLRRR